MQVAWLFILILTVVSYFALASFVLPKYIFKAGFKIPYTFDRGLKNYKGKNGRTIVYEPQPDYKKYVDQYILSERNGHKSLLCKLSPNISSIDYDVALFDAYNNVFQVLNINEKIKKQGYTNNVELPLKTMYASLKVNSADNCCVTSQIKQKTSYRKLAHFLAVAGLLTVLEIFLVKLCFANLFGDIFVESFMTSVESFFVTLGIGLGLILIVAAIVAITIKLKKKKNVGK